MRTELAIAALSGIVLAAAVVTAAPAELEVTVSSASVRVGDRVPVMVSARGDEDLMWGELKVAVETSGAWALVDGPSEVAGAHPPAWELVLVPLEVGELVLPAIQAGVRDASGEAGSVEAINLPTVDIVSVLPGNEEAQPAPLRDPLGVGGFPWEWVLPLAVPFLGVAVALAWWGRRRRLRRDGMGVVEASPFDELTALLDRLEDRVGREPPESICDRLAGGLRRYLDRTSGKPAEEMTSFELRLLARQQDWPDEVQRGIQIVMRIADRVRFARVPADDRELRQTIGSSRETASCLEDHLAIDDEEAVELEAAG